MSQQIENFLSNTDRRQILDPYRTLGSFVSGKITISPTLPLSFAVPTLNSYKIYSDSLAIKVVSPPLDNKVQSVITYNEYSYIKAGTKVFKMKYHHIVKSWFIPQQSISTINSILMKFDNIILLGEGKRIYIIDQNQLQQQIPFFEIKQPFNGMVHPVTYINKLLIFNYSSITLLNPLSQKILYQYPNLGKHLKQNQLKIINLQSSKLINIIAISLSNGQILIFNLKKDEIVFKVKLKLPAISIAFCDEESFMATSDEIGNVVLWDLQNKKILYKFEQFIAGSIDSLVFVPGHPILTCGSSARNCIKQLRINLEDNRILTLFRERVGIIQPIEKIQLLNGNQLMISSKIQSMFTSIYSHTNNYKLNRVLDSSQSYHIISKNFTVQLFKSQTLQKSFNIHETAHLGKISLSQKFYIVATKSRLIKLGISGIQIKISGIKEIILFQEHFVFVITDYNMVVLDFSTFQLIKELKIGQCRNSTVNKFGNLIAICNFQNSSIQVWDMDKVQLARQLKIETISEVKCLCFSADNKFLLSSHNKQLNVWSVIHSNLYKSFSLKSDIIEMHFTEDNQFFLSVFENERQIKIWNNYIGRISSSRVSQELNFKVIINYCQKDFRSVLKRKPQDSLMKHETDQLTHLALDQILQSIPDSIDHFPDYKFQSTQKWLPLIYYDQIKQRNTIQNSKEISLPFYLDFKNIDQQKKKMHQQIKQNILKKKNQKQQKIDHHLKNDGHQITINQQSKLSEFEYCIEMLHGLSIAQIDYQLRAFLINPINKSHILQMFLSFYQSMNRGLNEKKKAEEFLNIILHRTLYLIGNQIFDSDLKTKISALLKEYKQRVQPQKQKVNKCVAIIQKLM